MERSEAEGKLRHYHADFGDWIYSATVEEVIAKAASVRDEAETKSGERKLRLLGQAVQLQAVAHCLEVIGDDRPALPDTTNVRSLSAHKEDKVVVATARVKMASEDDIDAEFVPDGEEEPHEVFNMLDLTTRAAQPRFQRGDRAWVCTYGEHGVDGYMPVIVVGLEVYPDEIMYMWGLYNEEDGTVMTNFETCCEDEIWEEMPDTLNPPTRKEIKEKRHLSVVK